MGLSEGMVKFSEKAVEFHKVPVKTAEGASAISMQVKN